MKCKECGNSQISLRAEAHPRKGDSRGMKLFCTIKQTHVNPYKTLKCADARAREE